MQIAILLFDRFAALDAVALHDALSGVPEADITFTAVRPGPLRDETGHLELTADAALSEIPRPQVVVLPGGVGARSAGDQRLIRSWLLTAAAEPAWTTTIAEGALIAARAGLLGGLTIAAPEPLHAELASMNAAPARARLALDARIASAASAESAGELTSLLLTHLIKNGEHR